MTWPWPAWIAQLAAAGLGTRAANVLSHTLIAPEITSLNHLCGLTTRDLLNRHGCGRGTLADIEAALARQGLHLADRGGEPPRDQPGVLSSEVWP